MAAINTRIVRRTNALLGYAYGKDFRYSEVMSFAPGPKGLLQATAVTARAMNRRRRWSETSMPLSPPGESRDPGRHRQ